MGTHTADEMVDLIESIEANKAPAGLKPATEWISLPVLFRLIREVATPAGPAGDEAVRQVTGIVRYRYSERDDCVCHEGLHVYGYWLEGDDGKPTKVDASGWAFDAMRSVPDGTRLRFLAIKAEAPSPEQDEAIVRWLRAAPTRRMFARALGGGERPNDEYLSMATAILDKVATEVEGKPWLT